MRLVLRWLFLVLRGVSSAGRARNRSPTATTSSRTTASPAARRLPEVRLHFRTMGTPRYDSNQRIVNGVLIMHGSSGDASQVLAPSMIGPLTAAAARSIPPATF